MVNPVFSCKLPQDLPQQLSNNGVIVMNNATQVASKTQPLQIAIGDTNVTRLIYKDKPVITFEMIDSVHSRSEGTAGRNFRANRVRFIEGDDFYHLNYQEVSLNDEFRRSNIQANKQSGLIVLTQTGYLMLVKSFTDDLAWQVQRELVNKYFATPQPQTPPQSTALMSEVAETFKAYTTICECIGVTGNQLALAANAATVKHTGINPL